MQHCQKPLSFSVVLCLNMSDIEEAPALHTNGVTTQVQILQSWVLAECSRQSTAPSLLMWQYRKYNTVNVLFSTIILAPAVTPSTCSPMGLWLKLRHLSVLFLQNAVACFTGPSLLMWQTRKYNIVSVHLQWSLSTDAKLFTFAMLKLEFETFRSVIELLWLSPVIILATLSEDKLFWWMSRCWNEWLDFSSSHSPSQSGSPISVLDNDSCFTLLIKPPGNCTFSCTWPLLPTDLWV